MNTPASKKATKHVSIILDALEEARQALERAEKARQALRRQCEREQNIRLSHTGDDAEGGPHE
jgi:hypothetical protein